MVSIPACHAGDPSSILGRGAFVFGRNVWKCCEKENSFEKSTSDNSIAWAATICVLNILNYEAFDLFRAKMFTFLRVFGGIPNLKKKVPRFAELRVFISFWNHGTDVIVGWRWYPSVFRDRCYSFPINIGLSLKFGPAGEINSFSTPKFRIDPIPIGVRKDALLSSRRSGKFPPEAKNLSNLVIIFQIHTAGGRISGPPL